jgi:hypothetical protein
MTSSMIYRFVKQTAGKVDLRPLGQRRHAPPHVAQPPAV